MALRREATLKFFEVVCDEKDCGQLAVCTVWEWGSDPETGSGHSQTHGRWCMTHGDLKLKAKQHEFAAD